MAFSMQYYNQKVRRNDVHFLPRTAPCCSCVHLRRISVGLFWYKWHISSPLMEVQHFEHGDAIEIHDRIIFDFCTQLPHCNCTLTVPCTCQSSSSVHVHRYGAHLPVSLSAPCMVTGEESRVYSTEETMSSVDPPTTPSG